MTEMQKDLDRYLAFCAAKGVTQRGLEIVEDVISNPPARRVNTRSMASNITCRFPSRKMGVVIQAESRTLELPSIYLKEFDERVIGYWDQPYHRPNLVYKSKDRVVRTSVTLDFFVISNDFIGFEECKPVEVIHKEINKPSERYEFNDHDGSFVMPPLEEYLEGTGLGHRVFTDRQVNKVYVENLAFLYDFLDEPTSIQDRQLWSIAGQISDVSGGIGLLELEGSVKGLTRTSFYTAVADQALYVDLFEQDLRTPERLQVYANAERVESVARSPMLVEVDASQMSGSPRDMQEALDRFAQVKSILGGKPIADVASHCGASIRTLQRWLSAYRKDGLGGLEPQNQKKGNYNSKLDERVETCIEEALEEVYKTSEAKTPAHVYGVISDLCKERGLRPPSREAFYARLDAEADRKKIKIREGAKRAYQYTGYEGVEEGEEYAFRSVTRFLERCHIDHTQADIQLLSDEGAKLDKPWLTVITDEYSGFVLAVYLSFQKPNTISVMSVIRLMVFKHKVFPEAIVVDGGKEFESVYFETLMARRKCNIFSRKGKPRSGSAVERTYGTINTVLLDNLSGSNKLAKNIRQVSATHNPKNLAIWNAVDFYHGLLAFIDEWNSKSAKSGGLSPLELKSKSIERFGISSKRIAKYDHEFVMDTLPAPKRPTVRLKRNQKIQVNRVPYWHGCLRTVPRAGITADVRYDPFDLNAVYVFYQKGWLKFPATRKQHSKLDELDAAVMAEVARHSLYINEKAKAEVRSDLAASVEKINQHAKNKWLATESGHGSQGQHDACDIAIQEEAITPAEDVWAIEIPHSVEAD